MPFIADKLSANTQRLASLVLTCCLILTALPGVAIGSVADSIDAQAESTRVMAVRGALQMESAQDAVEGATREVLALISEGQTYADADPERFFTEVEALVAPMVDFPRFARNVMGPAYRKATADQRQRFADVFKWSLVRTYALALTEFRDGEVRVVPPRREARDPDKVKVVQEVTFRGRTYVAVYQMRRGKDRQWQVQNIIIEGVNIGVNFRTQFAQALRAEDSKDTNVAIDGVIASWAGESASDTGGAGEEQDAS